MLDTEIIEGIRSSNSEDRNKVFYYIYHNEALWNKVRSIVLTQGANESDIHELVQYALIVLDRKIRTPDFNLNSSIDTYFCSIVKHKWKFDLLNQKKKPSSIQIDNIEVSYEENFIYQDLVNEGIKALLWEIIDKMNHRCKALLPKWAIGMSGEELCKEFGFTTPEQAKKETYRCRQKLKEYVESVPGLKDKLKDLI